MSQDTGYPVGVDVGGTFTDIVAFDRTGMHVLKLPTSPQQSRAVLRGMRLLGTDLKRAGLVTHATTIATNALLTKVGLARTALITNEGFRDVLEIGRQRRPEIYSLRTRRPLPLVKRQDRFTVRCRVAADGSIVSPLSRKDALGVARLVSMGEFESVAVCFLNSYVNPIHEKEIGDALREAGFNGHVSLSCEVDREYREYERVSTTAVNAALAPLMSGYLNRLRIAMKRAAIAAPLYVMNSDGGMSSASFASTRPVAVIESGPAAGVLASRELARRLALDRVLTFDMGGTTAKAGTVIDGEPEFTDEFEAAGRTHSGRSVKGSGYAVRGSFIDLAEVSAGGGTIAWVDDGGSLAVGPQSAGSVPGPVCYGKGGRQPTVTDANVALGRLNPEYLLGGKMPIDAKLALGSLTELGRRLDMSGQEIAQGVLRLVNDGMAKAISIVSIERGHDPRDFTMVAFGGSGPVHACDLAEEIGMREVFIPLHAGLFSAYGLLVAEFARTFVHPVMQEGSSLRSLFLEQEKRAAKEMRREGFPRFKITRLVEVRYRGQSHELTIPYEGVSKLRRSFDRRHRELYGYSSSDELQIVNVKVRATVGRKAAPELVTSRGTGAIESGTRLAWFDGRTLESKVLRRESLSVGESGKGPCIIEEYDSTTVVNPSWHWKAEDYGTRLSR